MNIIKKIALSIKDFFCNMLDIKQKSKLPDNTDQNNNHYAITRYKQKKFMTESELDFYNKLKFFETNYRIIPQINLASIVQKINNNRYNTELFRNIDFAIFTKDYSHLLLLIELNDKTHEKSFRKRRDTKVRNICMRANINLITFYTKYPNDEQYVINRVLKEITIEEKVIEAYKQKDEI